MEMISIVFVLVGFASALVSAVFGFGTALIFLAIGSYLLPIKEAIALASVLFLASTLTKSLVYGRHIDWKLAGVMSFASVPFAYLGALFLDDLPGDTLKRSLGLMVLAYIGLRRFDILPRFRVGRMGLVAGSAAYGFVSGLLGSGNIVKAVIFREMNITKEAFVGAMAATSVLANMAKLHGYYQFGLLDVTRFWLMTGLVAAAISAVLVGRFLLRSVSVTQFEYGLEVVLLVCAFGLIF